MILFLFLPQTMTVLKNLASMDFAFLGQPFVEGSIPASLDMNTMDFAYLGQPFVRFKK